MKKTYCYPVEIDGEHTKKDGLEYMNRFEAVNGVKDSSFVIFDAKDIKIWETYLYGKRSELEKVEKKKEREEGRGRKGSR